jgi:cell division protein FtsA
MEQLITALDVGTSKIIAMVARKNPLGKLSILKTEEIDSGNCIRRGCVYNSTETARKISDLLTKLDGQIFYNYKTHLEEIYVGIGGQSLLLENYTITKEVPGGGTVNSSLLGEIETEIKEYQPELAKVFEILPPEYYLDGQFQTSPRGTEASVIEARFPLIVGSPKLKGLIERAFPSKYKIARFSISPLATAYSVLKKNEKDLGCALVEMGKGVTYVSIYKGGNLKYLFTIPLGGIAITKDIRVLNVSEEGAEKLKIKYGSAILDYGDETGIKIDDEFSTAKDIKLKDLNIIVEARSEEILVNVARKIEESGFADALGAGIILTGGAALLPNLPEALHNLTKKDVRLAYATSLSVNNSEITHPASHSCVIGLLAMVGKNTTYKAPIATNPFPTNPFASNPFATKIEKPKENNKPETSEPQKRKPFFGFLSTEPNNREVPKPNPNPKPNPFTTKPDINQIKKDESRPETVVIPKPVVVKEELKKNPVQPKKPPKTTGGGKKIIKHLDNLMGKLFADDDFRLEEKNDNESINKKT